VKEKTFAGLAPSAFLSRELLPYSLAISMIGEYFNCTPKQSIEIYKNFASAQKFDFGIKAKEFIRLLKETKLS
jgi:hypothetical protein